MNKPDTAPQTAWTPPVMDSVVLGFGAPVQDPEPFFDRIRDFNRMYDMSVSDYPSVHNLGVPVGARLIQFQKIIEAEITEGYALQAQSGGELALLTDLADWLGDIVVYCASEAAKYGIPLEKVLHVIMDSNESKLGADGKAIFKDGKLQKGPNYWKPEPKIRELLAKEMTK